MPDQLVLQATRPPPTVSVIIPTYNRASFLVDTIKSVLAQTYKHVEIVLVDDGSTDDTRIILHPYMDRITYIYQENRGRSAARNTGIGTCSGKYLVFLDSDDLLLPEKLKRQVSFLESHPEVDLVYSDGYTLNDDGSLDSLEPHVTTFPPPDRTDLVAAFLRGNLFAPHTALLRRGCLDAESLFDESIAGLEDWDLWLRLLLRGATFAYQDGKVVLYRRHGGNTDVVDPDTFVRARVTTVAKIVRQDLDRHLPKRIRQDFRLYHLGALARTRSPKVIGSALRTILWPQAKLSLYGLVALPYRSLLLSIRVALKATKTASRNSRTASAERSRSPHRHSQELSSR